MFTGLTPKERFALTDKEKAARVLFFTLETMKALKKVSVRARYDQSKSESHYISINERQLVIRISCHKRRKKRDGVIHKEVLWPVQADVRRGVEFVLDNLK